jgi:hypothetical protein
MIALSDTGLGYLVIAAGRIAPSHRGRWLKSIARELEGHQPSRNAYRLRKFQSRRHNGEKCFRLTLNEVDVEELLLASGTLAPSDRDDARAVERALERFISLCILDHRNAFQSDREICNTVRVGLCLSALRRKVSDGPPKRRRPSR